MRIFPKTFLDITLFSILFIALFFSIAIYKNPNNLLENTEGIIIKKDPFENIDLVANSAYIWDINNQKAIYEKNASTSLPLASITKLMTAIVALENSSKDYQFVFDYESLREEGDNGLMVGERWTIKDMLDFMLVMSSNDGARSVATAIEALRPEKKFDELMNEKASSLGFESLYFNNPTGLDKNEYEAGGYGNIRDVAKLYEYALLKYPEIFESTTKQAVSVNSNYFTHTAINTNSRTESILGIIGSKTGYSDLAGGNLGIITNIGVQRPIVILVLNSSSEERFEDVNKLILATREYISFEK
jgi:D-alanyl-D-alanine carboxypeptidase